jgi:hypothetical protein
MNTTVETTLDLEVHGSKQTNIDKSTLLLVFTHLYCVSQDEARIDFVALPALFP